MSWTSLPHLGLPLHSSARGVLAWDRDTGAFHRLAGDDWTADVTLPIDEDQPFILCAVAGQQIVAVRDDGVVAEALGLAEPRVFEASPVAEESDLLELDQRANPARATLIHTELDRGTWVLEQSRWRRIRSQVPREDMCACSTPAGMFVLGQHELFRVDATGWSSVARFDDEPDDDEPVVPTMLTCDPSRELLFGAADHQIVFLELRGWKPFVEAPGAVVGLAIDSVGDRLVVDTAEGTFALPLAPHELTGWLPGDRGTVAVAPVREPARLEYTIERYEPTDRALLGIKRGERLLALVPPDLAVFEAARGGKLRAAHVPDGVACAYVLFHPQRERHVVCRAVPEASNDDSAEPSQHTRVGGEPSWAQEPELPTCKQCRAAMRFRAQLCEDLYDCWFGDAGRVYVFACDAGCGASAVVQS